jgi:hypothetical protein
MESNEVNYRKEVKYGGKAKKTEVFLVKLYEDSEPRPYELIYFDKVAFNGIALIHCN